MRLIYEVQKNPFNRQLNKMVKHTQTIRRMLSTDFLSVFDHFVGLAFIGLNKCSNIIHRYQNLR